MFLIFLAVLCYSNIDIFVYSDSESIASQSERLLNEKLAYTIECTNNARNELIGTGRGANALGLANLHVNAFIDTYWYAPDSNAELVQALHSWTRDQIGLCLGEDLLYSPSPSPPPSPSLPTPSPSMSPLPAEIEVSKSQVIQAVSEHSNDKKLTLSSLLLCLQLERNFFYDFSNVYTCLVAKYQWLPGDNLLNPTDLFRLQYVEYFNGTESVNQDLLECGAGEDLIQFINSTIYDSIEENEDWTSNLAESLELSQTDCNIIVTAAVSVSIVPPQGIGSLTQFSHKRSFLAVYLSIFSCYVPLAGDHSIIYLPGFMLQVRCVPKSS